MPNLFESPADLNGYLFRILDNGGATADRYTVTFSDGSYLGLSGAPSHPQGFSQWGEGFNPAWAAKAVDSGEGVDLALGDLPDGLVDHILAPVNARFSEALVHAEDMDPSIVAQGRETASINHGGLGCFGEGLYWTSEGFRVRGDDAEMWDSGPHQTARKALLATLPYYWDLVGPEYHSTLDVMRLTPDPEVLAAVKALEARVDAAHNAGGIQ